VLALLGASLTLASLGVFPVVAGLGAALAMLVRWSFGDLERRATLAAAAAAVTVAGALSLLVSPVSIVRAFGALVALGLVFAIVFTFALSFWVLPETLTATAARPRRRGSPVPGGKLVRDAGGACLRAAVRRPGRVLGAALVLALAGWVLSTRTDVQPRLDRLAPVGTAQVDDANAVRRQTAFAGDVDVVVRSRRLASPAVLKWMSGYQRRVLARHGYREDRPCQEADLCPALSLNGLVGTVRSERQARADLDRLPRYFSRAVITPDRRTANLAFRLRAMSPGRSEDVIEDMRVQLDPPPGVTAELTALPAVVADTGAVLRTSWLALATVVLASILFFLIPRRRSEHSLAPLIPAVLATGWSALVLFLLPVPLNQLTASLAGFVVAFTTSLGLIVSAGYRDERRGGAAAVSSLERSYRENGGLLATAGTAAVAGFAALLASDVPMLNDLGVVAAIDLVLVLIAAALVLPAALVWAEERKPLELPRSRAEALAYARAWADRARAGASVAARFGGALAARARRAAGAAAKLRPPRGRGRTRTAKGRGESRPPSVEP
jgi:predicted RND superfamily exporter protein